MVDPLHKPVALHGVGGVAAEKMRGGMLSEYITGPISRAFVPIMAGKSIPDEKQWAKLKNLRFSDDLKRYRAFSRSKMGTF
ncbi:MAG TPA: hypothetical protein HA272_04625 [Methanoregula sp.]|nr:hypothetical protein [Methanoregula sp.]